MSAVEYACGIEPASGSGTMNWPRTGVLSYSSLAGSVRFPPHLDLEQRPMDLLELTQRLVAIDSVSRHGNREIADYLHELLDRGGFAVERLSYRDEAGAEKVSLVARLGEGTGGFGFFSHSDTVPGEGWDRNPFEPRLEGNRLIGLGSCDMKGPLAAALVAALDVDARRLKRPLFVVITADEEVGYAGAKQVAAESRLFRDAGPECGVVTEPTLLRPVHAHKGGALIKVVAHGTAAHTSTDRGVSANFLIAPFLAEMAELARVLKTDPSFRNDDFDPPTLGFNLVLNDGNTRHNVTASRTECTLFFRPMPNDRSADVLEWVKEKATRHGLDCETAFYAPFWTPPEAEVVQAALSATGEVRSETVPYGTDGAVLHPYLQLVVLGPGSIAQAHTSGEWIDLDQLKRAVSVYGAMIERLCYQVT